MVHTYSPQLQGSPQDRDDRRQAIEDLANAYSNTLEAFRDGTPSLTADDLKLLNLVPVSARIYAGEFKMPAPYDHLHPSYTLCALAIALNYWASSYAAPSLALYYNDPVVYADAQSVKATLVTA